MHFFHNNRTKNQKHLLFCTFLTGNGYIEGTELDGFLREFVESVNNVDSGPEVVSDAMMTELKQCFLEAYDDNKDGKIEIREVKYFKLSFSFYLCGRYRFSHYHRGLQNNDVACN